MSAVRDRWELVEPLLFAQPLRSAASFHSATTERRLDEVLREVRREHRFEEGAIAEAFDLLGDLALDRTEPICQVIRSESSRWLAANGDHWKLRVEHRRPGHEIMRWRGLTVLLPASIIVAGAMSGAGAIYPRRVRTLPESIAPREPVNHLHVHFGPMLPFEILWGHLWSTFLSRGSLDPWNGKGIDSIAGDALPEIAKSSDKRRPGMHWQWLLELAFCARAWLVQQMDGLLETRGSPATLRGFEWGNVDPSRRAGMLLAHWSDNRSRQWAHREARRLANARANLTRRELEYKDQPASPGSADTAKNAETDLGRDEELVFMTRALDHSGKVADMGDGFARLFYQYLRIKVALYGKLVVDPWATGLRHFLDVVARDKPYDDVINEKPTLERARLDTAHSEHPLRIGALEIHIPPESWLKRDRRREQTARHAWVLSFVRAPKSDTKDPEGIGAAKRWRRHVAHVATVCRLLGRRIEACPTVLRHVRALSLMDWERNGPVWLFERHFRRLIEISSKVAARHPGLNLAPLRTAFHLGEDFDHVLTGLRQIYEPFVWGLVGRGDRIGHALALGLEPSDWCKQISKVRMRPWDRLLDVGFVCWAIGAFGLPLEAENIARIRVSAAEALGRLFPDYEGDPLDAARNLWLALPTNPPIRSIATPLQLRRARNQIDELLDSPRIGRAALSQSLVVDTTTDLPLITAVHRFVHTHVAMMHVAIEVNPSSNLLVGGFRSIFEQPVFHLDDLPIIINADDPLSFATTLADDFSYAWAGMVLMQNVTPHAATARLEEAARCSRRYAFNGPDIEGRMQGTVGTK